MLGVAAKHAAHSKVLVTGVTGLVAGAMAMAAGEYVSVHFQGTWESSSLPYRWRFGQVGGFSGTRSSFLPTDGASRMRCSQADTEKADVELERMELKTDDAGEHTELAAIYVGRGLAVEFGSVLLRLEALHRS